ncbi:hypothetical protein AYI69_g4262 [Smittium culicis]|uniref:Uncharacterized protein n=1 Tax=Smittium culicis TaxID=133412 RepID=A0A1R1YF25_9FUNG|nr:hypothetical protein AYI69_g4262 [Smittium culicis]
MENNLNHATNQDATTSEGGKKQSHSEEFNDIIRLAPNTVNKSLANINRLNSDNIQENIDGLSQSSENNGPLKDENGLNSAKTFIVIKGDNLLNHEESNYNYTNKDSNNCVANSNQKKILISETDLKITESDLNTSKEYNNNALNIQIPDIQCDPSKFSTINYQNENVIAGSQLKKHVLFNPSDPKENYKEALNCSNIEIFNHIKVSDSTSFDPDLNLNTKKIITDIDQSSETYFKKSCSLPSNPQRNVVKSKAGLKLPASGKKKLIIKNLHKNQKTLLDFFSKILIVNYSSFINKDKTISIPNEMYSTQNSVELNSSDFLDDDFSFVSENRNDFTNLKENVKQRYIHAFPVPISNHISYVPTIFENTNARKPDNMINPDDLINTDSAEFPKLGLGLNIVKFDSEYPDNNTDSLIKTRKSDNRLRTYLSPSPKVF